MKKPIAVVALGGNAIIEKNAKSSVKDQFEATSRAMKQIMFLSKKYNLVITHGNGPQVGAILIRSEAAAGKTYTIPLSVAVAESEGEMGYMIQQCLHNELGKRQIASVLTQVLVDRNDGAFRNPTKPIGPFYTKSEAMKMRKNGMDMKEDSGRGWRRVVPSPRPLKIIEAETIKRLARDGIIVVAAGGGGIPVAKKGKKLQGVDAVIDKDYASAKLAEDIGAALLVVLTGVDSVYLNYGQKNQRPVKKMSAAQAERFQHHFPEGSMMPKVLASAAFARSGGRAVITSHRALKKAMLGRSGTWFVA